MRKVDIAEKKRRIRTIFIVCFIFLPIQYLVVGGVSYIDQEPWPAFVMPGFKSVYVENRKYVVPKTEFTLQNAEDKPTLKLRPHQFLTGIPRSQVLGVVDLMMSSEEHVQNLNTETKEWLKKNGEELAGEQLGSIQVSKVVRFYSRPGKNLELRIDSIAHQFTATINFEQNE
ncbi:MAG: hypothetical protein GVY02_09690 [Bacteroidetes bacterium]|jgi:hypothetical protein|nr:hypothetical protein [Bacteroidota bacterium]